MQPCENTSSRGPRQQGARSAPQGLALMWGGAGRLLGQHGMGARFLVREEWLGKFCLRQEKGVVTSRCLMAESAAQAGFVIERKKSKKSFKC